MSMLRWKQYALSVFLSPIYGSQLPYTNIVALVGVGVPLVSDSNLIRKLTSGPSQSIQIYFLNILPLRRYILFGICTYNM